MISVPLDAASLEWLFRKYLIPFFLKVAGAFVLWFLAGILIKGLKGILIRALEKKNVDPTLVIYAKHSLGLLLKALTLILILGVFGVETTSFSAILAAAGVAIGVAWSGLLSNFAAGIFLVLFRPFKLGDTICAGGVTGIVREIGLFATSIDNGENVRHFVGNNKIFSDTIQNFSHNDHRVAAFRIQLAYSVDPVEAIEAFRVRLAEIEGVMPHPAPGGEITEFNPTGTLITLKVAVPPGLHALVMQEGHRKIAEVLRAQSYPAPEIRTVIPPSARRSES